MKGLSDPCHNRPATKRYLIGEVSPVSVHCLHWIILTDRDTFSGTFSPSEPGQGLICWGADWTTQPGTHLTLTEVGEGGIVADPLDTGTHGGVERVETGAGPPPVHHRPPHSSRHAQVDQLWQCPADLLCYVCCITEKAARYRVTVRTRSSETDRAESVFPCHVISMYSQSNWNCSGL